MKKTNRTKFKKAFSVIGSALAYLFLFLCLGVLVLTLTAKKDSDGAATIFGFQMRIVLSSSMEKCEQTDVSAYEIKDIPVKSVVFVQTVPESKAEADAWYQNLQVGDVLTFRYMYAKQETITHRIVEIAPNEFGGYYITLEGDNKASNSVPHKQVINTSETNSPNFVLGKVVAKSHALGVVLSAVKTPVGMALIIIIPCLAIALLEIVKVADILSKSKKEKIAMEKQKADDEVAELKKQLEELRAANFDAAKESKTIQIEERKN